MLIAAYLLFRGHNLPGGGFIAGLLTATVFVLQFVAAGRAPIARVLPFRPDALIALGLALAALTGVGAQLFGQPFLTSTYGHLALPVLGVGADDDVLVRQLAAADDADEVGAGLTRLHERLPVRLVAAGLRVEAGSEPEAACG